MNMQKVNIAEKLKSFDQYWQPKIVSDRTVENPEVL